MRNMLWFLVMRCLLVMMKTMKRTIDMQMGFNQGCKKIRYDIYGPINESMSIWNLEYGFTAGIKSIHLYIILIDVS